MTRDEMVKEIQRVEDALRRTDSRKLKHDYGKHLKRLYRDLKFYDKEMSKWQMSRT